MKLILNIVSLLTKTALMVSFKNIVGPSSSYQHLQSDYVNKLSGAKGMQVFDDSTEGKLMFFFSI